MTWLRVYASGVYLTSVENSYRDFNHITCIKSLHFPISTQPTNSFALKSTKHTPMCRLGLSYWANSWANNWAKPNP